MFHRLQLNALRRVFGAPLAGGLRYEAPMIRSCSIMASAVLLAVVFFAGGPPWTMWQSPSEISLRWWSDENTIGEAQGIATAHCGTYGRRAHLLQEEKSGSAEIAHFACR